MCGGDVCLIADSLDVVDHFLMSPMRPCPVTTVDALQCVAFFNPLRDAIPFAALESM